jgi:hypothetical protein
MATTSTRTRLKLSIGAGGLVLGSLIAYAAIPTILAIGQSDHIGLAGGPATLVARHLVTPAGETTGAWHYHPGYVYNIVKSGTVVVEDGCGAVKEYTAGQAFETSEGRVHRAYNLGDVDAVEYNMFVNIGSNNSTLTKLIPNNERRCGPPSTVDECAGSGWMGFNHPAPFDNQGQCVAYVRHRRTITLLVPEDPL